jgi:heme exporter protein CcmD
MDHTPFIIAAYGVAGLLLSWCALGPLLHGSRLRTRLRKQLTEQEHDRASRP